MGSHWISHSGCGIIAVTCIAFSLIIVLFRIQTLLSCQLPLNTSDLASWFSLGNGFTATFSINLDGLSSIMLVMILVVSTAVHLFSVDYMHNDFQKERFLGLLSIFTLFMLLLVTADNLLQLLLGWEVLVFVRIC